MDALPNDADAPVGAPRDRSRLTDSDLLDLLRTGDPTAYEELWLRHVGAARRAALRIAPIDHEDLVSEAFLAIYRQVAVDGKGPRTSFRAYLFTVMRNIAARWYREGRAFVSDPDADAAVEESGYDRIEREQDDAQVLDAFRALPTRWQRVLWLSEIENVGRPAIAAELGIGPNAVSALQRRARGGLREQWLTHQLPKDLREDREHVASMLPARIISGKRHRDPEVERHLAACERCSRAEAELRQAYGSSRGAAASISGLAALGVILPGATTLWAAPASVSIAAGVGFSLVASAAAVVGAMALGIGSGFIPLPGFSDAAQSVESVAPSTEADPDASIGDAAPAAAPTTPPLPVLAEPSPATEEPESIDFFVPDGPVTDLPSRPAPTPAPPGTVPPPAEDQPAVPDDGTPPPDDGTPPPDDGTQPDDSSDDGTPPTGDPSAPPAPVVTASYPAEAYMAPMMSGSAPADSTVAVGVGDDVYTVEPSPTGKWSFDARSLSLPAGDYTAEVWTVVDGVSSTASTVPFTITAVTVTGFEGDVLMDLDDASTTGLVFTLVGPASGTACVSSDVGQAVTVPLDADGTVTRRIRFLTTGFYALTFSACSDGYNGPGIDEGRWVSSGIFDPWDDVPYFELDEIDDAEPVD